MLLAVSDLQAVLGRPRLAVVAVVRIRHEGGEMAWWLGVYDTRDAAREWSGYSA